MANIASRRLAGGASNALLIAALATGGTAALFAATSLVPMETGLVKTADAQNSFDTVCYGGKYKTGKVAFSVSKKWKLTSRYGNRASRVTVKGVEMAVSNGRYIYASSSKYSSKTMKYRHNQLMRIDAKTSKTKVLAKGRGGFVVLACTDRYLYYTWDAKEMVPNNGGELYLMDMRTGKSKKLGNHGLPFSSVVGFIGDKALVSNWGANGCKLGYIYNYKGANPKKLRKATGVLGVKGGNIYYFQLRTPKYHFKYKVYRCETNGKHAKALTGWSTDQLPTKYTRMFRSHTHTAYSA